MNTLAIDIGGSRIKAMLLNAQGYPLSKYLRVSTPKPGHPEAVLSAIAGLGAGIGPFDRVSVGFPGVVRSGHTLTAHLDPAWIGFDLERALSAKLGKPVRTANDADVQGLATIAGVGVELVLTLGTGFGSSLFIDGRLVPNLQLAHQLFYEGKTYEQHLGNPALKQTGLEEWNRLLSLALVNLQAMFNYEACYLGGGNSRMVALELPANVRITANVNGVLGGFRLW